MSELAPYDRFASLERQLRLVVEVRSDAHQVYVYESPVHALPDAQGAPESLLPFRVQRSFTRHIGTRVASCAQQGMLPISLQFSLTHPLFQSRLESAAVVSPTSEQCDFELRRESSSTALMGFVRVRLGSASVHMELDPRLLVAL